MKVNDTVKVIEGTKKGLVGEITRMFDSGRIEVYFKSLEGNPHILNPFQVFYDKSYLEVIDESL